MQANLIETLQTTFQQVFEKTEPGELFFSPGRVNLIGEHTDYNGGYVFPCAITQGTYAVVSKRTDSLVQCYSMNFESLETISFSLDNLVYDEADSWTNYVKGMLLYLKEAGHSVETGFNILIYGNIPNGAGLSSSASLELLVGIVAEELYQLELDRMDLVHLGKRVENQFMGVQSGIMDQFAVGMGHKGMAIHLDTNTLDYELVPADFGEHVLLIMNTNKRRELADSQYNKRRSECEAALERLQSELAIEALGDLSEQEFEANRHLIKDELLEKRAKHAVYENERTKKAKVALTEGNLEAFGQLLNQSHISLRDDYDVTGIELDTLAEAAWEQEGVLGARMTGAGMGGCAICLVHKDYVEAVKNAVQSRYQSVVGYPADFYVAEVGDGAKKL